MTITNLSSSIELSADGMGKTVIDIPLSGSVNVAYQTPWNSVWKIELSGANTSAPSATFIGRLQWKAPNMNGFIGTISQNANKSAWDDYTDYYMYVCQIPTELSNIFDGSTINLPGKIGLYFNDAWAFSTTYHPSGDNNTQQSYDNAKFTRVG